MKYPLFKIRMSTSVMDNIADVFNSNWIGEGDEVVKFESKLTTFFGSPTIALNSCTSALHLAFNQLKCKGYKKVFLTPLTCFATTTTALQAGFDINWVDIDLNSLNIDLNDLNNKYINDSIICLIHFGGRPASLSLNYQNTPIVEDCAHCFGTKEIGLNPNSYSCFSFQAVKSLTTVDGGAIIPPSDEFESIKLKRWYGMDRSKPRNQDIFEIGFKYHMNNLNASIGLANFEMAIESVDIQKSNAKYYSENLKSLSLPFCDKSSYWLYPIIVDNKDRFTKHLNHYGIETTPAHFRNDTRYCVKKYKVDLPNMDFIEKHMTCIPNGYWIDKESREFIVDVINKGW